ncbi:TrbI/VirB10 family protein [Rhodohalobacter sp. 614A]|uniref:TrbI/VirB10 family protein n=1 Tax=Rhodohalobacter sp. 614A TaxID=2908649 RepID=UPI001F4088BF|nr:TrbI/VirB10 family protein [Rhodohalobacter sp. 614A]
MRPKEEKNKINESSKRLLLLGALALGGILLATILFNIFQSGNSQRKIGEYQPPVQSGEPGFLQNEPAGLQTDEEELDFDPPDPQSIFDRPVSQPTARTSQPGPQQPDRRQELYEQALSSDIKIGGEVRVSDDVNPSMEQAAIGRSVSSAFPADRRQSNSTGQEPLRFTEEQNNQGTVEFNHPPTPYTLLEGTMIEATLQTGVSSALPGNIVGMINRDVYDSINQEHLIIPRGTRIVGTYDSGIAFDQRKMMMSWQRLLFPDGRSIQLPSFPTHDLQGMSGLGGEVNTHFWRIFGQSAMLSLIGAGASLAVSPNRAGLFGAMSARELIAVQIAEDFQRVANMVLQRNMNRQPTIVIEAGTPFTIYLLDDLSFEEPYTYTEAWYGE